MSFAFHLTCHCGVFSTMPPPIPLHTHTHPRGPHISLLINLFTGLRAGETGRTRRSVSSDQPTCLRLVINEYHPGPQRVLRCCKGPGIIWIGACAIAICPSPPPPRFSSIPANCHTGVHKHCCPSAGQNTGQGPVTPSYAFMKNQSFKLSLCYTQLRAKSHCKGC